MLTQGFMKGHHGFGGVQISPFYRAQLLTVVPEQRNHQGLWDFFLLYLYYKNNLTNSEANSRRASRILFSE